MTFRRSAAIGAILAPVLAIAQDSELSLLDESFGVQKVASGCEFTEGPTVDTGGNLYFSDGPKNRIMKLSAGGELTEFINPSGAANGLLVDQKNRLILCQSSREGGGRAVARADLDTRKIEVLTEKFEGNRYIAPNDVCTDSRGRIYFTDPYYSGEKSQPSSGVYRIDPSGKVTCLLDKLLKPNGIVITPDSRMIYVSDRGTQKLHRYQVAEDGSLTADGIVYDFSPDRGIDGMWLDIEGNIYGAAGKDETTGLFVISPDGKLLLHKPMPEFSTNVTFGGKDRRDLYLTATTSVYHMRTRIPGAKLPELK